MNRLPAARGAARRGDRVRRQDRARRQDRVRRRGHAVVRAFPGMIAGTVGADPFLSELPLLQLKKIKFF